LKAKVKMSEFFLELFSEEVPAKLQVNARKNLFDIFKKFFEENEVNIKGKFKAFSTPNRLVIYVDKIQKNINKKSEEIRGPSTKAPEEALDGFIRSNKIKKSQIYKKMTEKGDFYFYKRPSKKINTFDLIRENIPKILSKISWNKSMKWGNFDLYWGRPLKSILTIFDGKKVDCDFHHLKSSDTTYIDKDFEEKTKIFKNFKSYYAYFKSIGVIIDQDKRKSFIKNELTKLSNKKNLNINFNEKLLDEITNIVEKPKILLCEFDKKFLDVPKEIIIITMQNHQKYFPTFDKKKRVTNNFFVVADVKDQKGFVKLGNERVVEARLSDAEFFWKRNKYQNLVKQVSKLKDINYFTGLGSYFDKVQRIRKLSARISDDLLISKEKMEIASTVCKVDLMSDLVGEFPELQGLMGGYFAETQGFDKDVSLAISEHYLPLGMEGRTPKKLYSIALSLSDKVDSLVGFFGINLKPTSSKDPYALRRMAISLIRLIIENDKNIKIRDLINYSCMIYKEQSFEFDIKLLNKELSDFILERLKNYMKDKKIRHDIIESSVSTFSIDDLTKIFKKSLIFNKNIKKDVVLDAVAIYKRSSNIIISEVNKKNEINGSPDPALFKNNFEKNLYKRIHDIRKYFSNVDREEDYIESLKTLSNSKNEVNNFFDNVVVNDNDPIIKKNRLELLKMLCKSFENYFNFSKIEA
tara:strand:- start:1760 stop:3841 length:2082 start_codon:yes stop_codon:yes gene_type:complete